ncbi:hypothetical protein DYY67_0002 [Candidatus Nitrosotalea sp. TS]|nr:hypothetical protein [Candidatus Nitrosotalea sp. TS]
MMQQHLLVTNLVKRPILFDFSPNGSPIVHQTPVTQNNTQFSQNPNESNPISQTFNQHELALRESISVNDTMALTKINPAFSDSEPSQPSYDFKNILYPVMAICWSRYSRIYLVS